MRSCTMNGHRCSFCITVRSSTNWLSSFEPSPSTSTVFSAYSLLSLQ